MAELKTRVTDVSPIDFLNEIPDDQRRQDSFIILEMMRAATGAEPRMWGASIIGFGDSHYRYESGWEGDWFITGFSPRKQNLTLYIAGGIGQYPELLQKLGKHKTGKGCLYIKKLSDIDIQVLQDLIEQSVRSASNSGAES